MYKEKLQRITYLNNRLDKYLNFPHIKNNFQEEVVYKIVYTNLWNYKKNLLSKNNSVNTQQVESYFKTITNFIYKNIYIKNAIEKEAILKLHSIIMKEFPRKKTTQI